MSNGLKIILQIIGSAPIAMLNIYCWNSCLNKTIKDNKKASFISFLSMNIMTAVLNYTLPKGIRMFVVFIYLVVFCYFYLTKNINKSILLVLISQGIIAISEFTFVIITSLLCDNIDAFMNSTVGFWILNIYIIVISYIIIKNKFALNIYNKISNLVKTFTNNETVIYLTIIIFVMVISTIESHMNLPMPVVLAINTSIAVIIIFIILRFAIIKARYNKINSKYQTSITSLKEYESMIDKFRVNNHENKNELLTIRSMINAKDKKTISYIDKLVDNKIKDNEKIMYKTSKIPEGGLRAIIYSKLTIMEKYKIKYTLDIANDVRTTDLINLSEELILNICKILGVFLDNAIDAVKDLKKKNVNIEIYIMDNQLCIDITNNFKDNLDLSKLGNQKYTTKGEGHGYGLSLVNQIISENPKMLENEKSINKDTFTQTLKIKM